MNILHATWIAMVSVFHLTTAWAADIEVVVDKSALGPPPRSISKLTPY
jgi:hypothetical protein